MDTTESIAFFEDRANIYRLMGNLTDTEVTGQVAAQLRAFAHSIPSDVDNMGDDDREVCEGILAMGHDVRHFDEDEETRLRCDFARVFLAAGRVDGRAACPYESIYTSKEHLLMQDARDQVRACYRFAGVMPGRDQTVPDDYLPFMCEYLAVLCDRAVEALEAEDSEKLTQNVQLQREFVENHLANWIPDLYDDIKRVAETGFYKGFAAVLRGFVAYDLEDISAF